MKKKKKTGPKKGFQLRKKRNFFKQLLNLSLYCLKTQSRYFIDLMEFTLYWTPTGEKKLISIDMVPIKMFYSSTFFLEPQDQNSRLKLQAVSSSPL